jgi:hypothetical protein
LVCVGVLQANWEAKFAENGQFWLFCLESSPARTDLAGGELEVVLAHF